MTDQHGWARRVADWLVPDRNPAGVLYGLITIGALLAAESANRETYAEAIGSAAIAMVLYWFAHAYSNVLGRRLETRERLTVRALLRECAHDWAIVRGAAIPLLTLLVAWTVGAGQGAGVTAALWSTVVSLIAFELLAGIRSHATPREFALEGAVGIAMGIAILALKIVLH